MVSKLIENMKPSVTLALSSKVTELKSQGVDVISFNVGEPDYGTPQNIVEAAKAALDAGHTKYTDVPGVLELRKAICEKLSKDNGLTYTPAQICVSAGAKQALVNAATVLCNPGDEVIIPTPCWVSYIEIVRIGGGVPVLAETVAEEGFQLNPERLKKVITPKTRAILLNNPNNPTGALYTKKTLEAVHKLAKEHNLYIISDEIYEKLIYSDEPFTSFASLDDDAYTRTITINGFSKAYSMTGWRVGYSAAPLAIAKGISSLQSHTTTNANSIAQYACIEALRGPQDKIEEMRLEFDKRRKYLLSRLNGIPGFKPIEAEGAFYIMADVTGLLGKKTADGTQLNTSVELCEYILAKAHVSAVPGDAFECPGFIRISYSNSLANIERGMDRINELVKTLS